MGTLPRLIACPPSFVLSPLGKADPPLPKGAHTKAARAKGTSAEMRTGPKHTPNNKQLESTVLIAFHSRAVESGWMLRTLV